MEKRKRWHPIRNFFTKAKHDADIEWFRNLCKFYWMDFGKYDIQELVEMYIRDWHNIKRD